MKRGFFYLVLLASVLFLSACGKNDAVYPVRPLTQAPPPQYGGYQPQYPGGPGTFQPQFPPGQPPQQFYPFVPIDNYFRQRPQFQQYYPQMWSRWQQYAGYYGTNQYDFTTFWLDFCPQDMQAYGYGDAYNYVDTSFYYWVQPETYFDVNVNVNTFWDSYDGYYWGDSYCSGGCY